MSLKYPDIAALLLRIGFGVYMLLGHGLGKFMKLIDGGAVKFPALLGMPPKVCLGLAVLSEFIGCILIIIGYKTRLAAILMIITMIVAAFVVHFSDPFFMQKASGGSKEPAMLYLIAFVAIYFLGSGKYSVDDKLDSVL